MYLRHVGRVGPRLRVLEKGGAPTNSDFCCSGVPLNRVRTASCCVLTYAVLLNWQQDRVEGGASGVSEPRPGSTCSNARYRWDSEDSCPTSPLNIPTRRPAAPRMAKSAASMIVTTRSRREALTRGPCLARLLAVFGCISSPTSEGVRLFGHGPRVWCRKLPRITQAGPHTRADRLMGCEATPSSTPPTPSESEATEGCRHGETCSSSATRKEERTYTVVWVSRVSTLNPAPWKAVDESRPPTPTGEAGDHPPAGAFAPDPRKGMVSPSRCSSKARAYWKPERPRGPEPRGHTLPPTVSCWERGTPALSRRLCQSLRRSCFIQYSAALRPATLPRGVRPRPTSIKQTGEAGIPGAQAEVTGDGHHFQAERSAPPEFAVLSDRPAQAGVR